MKHIICRVVTDSTGHMNFETIGRMTEPVIDINEIIKDDKRYGYLKLDHIKYRFVEPHPRGMNWWQWERAFIYGVRRIVPYIKDFKSLTPAKPGEYAHFEISTAMPGQDQYMTDNTIMYAYYPTLAVHPFRGRIVVNGRMWFSADGSGISAHIADPKNYPDPNTNTTIATLDADKVFCHELFHTWLGMPHDPVENNMMYYNEQGMSEMPSERDIMRAQAKAGKRNVTEQYIRSFIERLKRVSNYNH